MDRRILYIGILILCGSSTGLALKCYSCTNLETAHCLNDVGPDLLIECPQGTINCTLEIKNRGGDDEFVYRKCGTKNWVCRHECSTCTKDGCNGGKKVEQERPNSTITVTPMEIIMANIYGISAIGLVVFLLLVWVIAKSCSRDKDTGYEDDEEDEDEFAFDEIEDDYEGEDYDEDDYDGDSIEKEYEEYEQEAEEEYTKRKQRKVKKEMV